LRELSLAEFVDRRSRFHAHLYEIESLEEVKEILKLHRRNHRKARHHCLAARKRKGDRVEESHRNDGEVGHPGQVLMELLRREDLDSHCLIVSRIFGGVKLGAGGVSRAFRQAGEMAIMKMRKG